MGSTAREGPDSGHVLSPTPNFYENDTPKTRNVARFHYVDQLVSIFPRGYNFFAQPRFYPMGRYCEGTLGTVTYSLKDGIAQVLC